ncbi:hypothetical protein [Pinirhizobacter sp.]|jgi:hypothetical protein|uniref:hypothetical protein n=1 Tax=Pinirhizobacter sp. TaxID=2950432 RepID=UPI002F3FCC44
MSDNPNLLRTRKQIVFSLKLAAVMLGGSLLLVLARKQGWVDAEHVLRANNVILGLALAAFSNATPKMLNGPPRSLHHATLAQAAGRVSGWTMTVAFLIWAALWAFAPREYATILSVAAVVASVVVSIGYAVWKSAACRASKSD